MATKNNVIDVKDSEGISTGKYWIENLDDENNLSVTKDLPKEGAALYKGQFTTGESVAIKIYTNRDTGNQLSGYTSCFQRAQENLEFLSLLGNEHPNLITYYGHHKIGEKEIQVPQCHKKIKMIIPLKTYLFTELCICSVRELVINQPKRISKEKQQEILNALPHKAILKQSAMAVNFLHGLGLVHRNLHPNNFLIQRMDKDGQYVVKLTDFQLAKDWEKNRDESNRHPMIEWKAVPECPHDNNTTYRKERDSKSDVYTLGCYFYFVLSGGYHPFGGIRPKDKKIFDQNSKPYLENWSPDDGNMNVTTLEERGKAVNLIWNMIRFYPTDRKSMWEVLDSDYFNKEPSHYQIYDDPEKRKPGLCVIICQEKFHDPGDDMDGMGRNCAQLRRTFFRFGYEVLVYQNMEAKQIKDLMKTDNLADASKEKFLSKYASLVVCILSHGGRTNEGEEYVLGVDGVPVKTEPLIRKFNNYNCEGLAGKPKIFIIFSCRGEKSQRVLQHNPVLPVSSQSSAAAKQDDVTVHGNNDTKSAMEDFLVLRSTIPEFYSYFYPGKGAPFIEHLCAALISEYNLADLQLSKEKKKDLVSLYHSYVVPLIGREVIELISPDGSTVRQTPESRSTLTKTIRFLPKVSTSDIASLLTAEKQNLAVKFNGMDELQFYEKREKKLKEGLVKLKKDIEQLKRAIKALGNGDVDKKKELDILLLDFLNEQQKLEFKKPEVLKDLQERKKKGGSCASH